MMIFVFVTVQKGHLENLIIQKCYTAKTKHKVDPAISGIEVNVYYTKETAP